LKWVLDRLKTSALKARLSKCHFFRCQLHFLGHIVSADGLAPDSANVETIVNWPSPRSLFEVRSFLGLAKNFRRFIRHYDHIAAPLTALLKGADKADRKGRLLQQGKLSAEHAARVTTAFTSNWIPECDSAFSQLKQALVQAPVLVLPDFKKPFTLVCDACDLAIGGILLQESRPVAYYSRKLQGRSCVTPHLTRKCWELLRAFVNVGATLKAAPSLLKPTTSPIHILMHPRRLRILSSGVRGGWLNQGALTTFGSTAPALPMSPITFLVRLSTCGHVS
jgi:hypothetical protein